MAPGIADLVRLSAIEGALLVGVGLVGLVGLAHVSPRIDRLATKLAIAVFGRAVAEESLKRTEREHRLHAVHEAETYTVYASKTFLYAGILGVAGSLLGIAVLKYLLVVAVAFEAPLEAVLPPALHGLLGPDVGGLSFLELFALMAASSATVGLASAAGAYGLRWRSLASRADRRRVLIDESLARTIAFVYALGRTGMGYPDVFRTVARNRRSFGESAAEIAVAVKDMDLFGADLSTALERVGRRSPSDEFADFAENFATVFESGQNVTSYLRDQYEQYQSERIANQERLLELFAALGEAYVAGLVAGPLFLLTILLTFGILTGQLIEVLQFVVYVAIPLANLGFVVYLGSVSAPLAGFHAPVTHHVERIPLAIRRADRDRAPVPDGGVGSTDRLGAINLERLRAFNRFRGLKRVVFSPVGTIVDRPTALLVATIPIAAIYVTVRLSTAPAGSMGIRFVDDLLIQSFVFVAGTFAIARAVQDRRRTAIDRAVPDFLERLASSNEAGMTFTQSLRRVDRSDLGVLNDEIERLIADIEWGARTETALLRFSNRLRSSTVARIVALITNAMAASGDIGDVVRIAADEAREDRRLRLARKQEMFLYVLIVYLSFLVFIGIALALEVVLIPSIPPASALSTGEAGALSPSVSLPVTPATMAERPAYTLVLFHAAVVQAVASGLVAGQMGEGSLKDGAKHATALVVVAYVVFSLI